ncbi:MAG: hypothetical protein AB1498_08610 [bacterium]
MIDKKIFIIIFTLIITAAFSRNNFAQGLNISGGASFSYSTSDSSDNPLTVDEMSDSFSQNYSLNLKTDLTSKGTARSAVRYTVTNNIKSKTEATDLSVDLSYDIVSWSIALQDNTNSDFDQELSNNKGTNFTFQVNPQVLPRFSLTYASSIQDNEITPSSSRSVGLQFSKNFVVLGSNLSSAVSYTDNSDNITGEQTTDNRFNVSYAIRLLSDKLGIATGYRIGNTYDVIKTASTVSESKDVNITYDVFQNFSINTSLAISSNFANGKEDIAEASSFRLQFIPIKGLNFALNLNQSQTNETVDDTSAKNFTASFPAIFDVLKINYSYGSSETRQTLDATNSVDLSLDLAPLNISDFTTNAGYGNRRSRSITVDSLAENENFRFSIGGRFIDKINVNYNHNLDKTTSNIDTDNRDATSNSINLSYGLTIIEDLNGTISTSYTHNQNISPASSSANTTYNYNGALNYKLKDTNVSFSGSLDRTFNETGAHVSQRTNVGPGISTKFLGLSLAINASFGEDSSDGELSATRSTNYSITTSYPLGTIGSGSFSYNVGTQENLKNPSDSKNDERFSFNMSFTF